MSTTPVPLPRFLGGTSQPQPQYRLLKQASASRPPATQPLPAAPSRPLGQDTANFRPVLDANGQVVAYMLAPAAPTPPAKPGNKAAELGKAVLGVATTGLGVAGVAFPPAVGIAGITGVVELVDDQIGNPIATVVGTTVQVVGKAGGLVVDGVEGAVKGIGHLFGNLFGK